MKFLGDENFPFESINMLIEYGYQVTKANTNFQDTYQSIHRNYSFSFRKLLASYSS